MTIPASRVFVQKLPHAALTLGTAALITIWVWPLVANDMAVYLIPWFGHIVAAGPVHAFAEPFSNYSPAYLYLLAAMTPLAGWFSAMTLIKTLSMLGTVALALTVRRLLLRLDAPQPHRAALLVFVLPSVAMNAALLGQCDAMWTAPLVMALVAALDRRHAAMLAWCGLALGFKAQAALAAPFFLALAINRRVPFRMWPIAPAVAAATMLPAWLAGWPAADLATIYLRQAGMYDRLSLNAPNIWAIVQALPLGVPLLGLACAAAIGASAAYIACFSAVRLGDRQLLGAALLASLLTAGLLPRMHERYFFLADVLALALALTSRDRAGWRIALLIQGGSASALLGYLSGIDALAMLGGVATILATVQSARPLLKPAANDNPLLARAA